MIVGVPRESHAHEHRVGLSPFAISRLTNHGHAVVVEKGTGEDAHFTDAHYQSVGAQIVYSGEEVFRRADIVCGVERMTAADAETLQRGATVCAFQHLAVAGPALIDALRGREATVLGYELIQDETGESPVLVPFAEMAGHMVLQLAARFLQSHEGGRGILLGAIPSVAPPTVLILGAGRVGHSAAMHALDAGCHVVVIDSDPAKLRRLHYHTGGRAVTILAGMARLEKYTSIADVVIGAVLVPGGRAPFVVGADMVKGMKPGSVILDLSIDQGGCIETSRPTTIADPTFTTHGVTHYCVPNMTAGIPRTASRALTSAVLPYLMEIAGKGIDAAIRADKGLCDGIYMYRGKLVNQRLGDALGAPVDSICDLLGEGDAS